MSKQSPVTIKKYTAPALEKGLEIIELLGESPDGLKLTDIADQLGRTKTEIFRMIAVLNERQYIDYFPETHLYRLSLKLFRISHRYAPIQQLSNISRPVMKKLADTIAQSCHMVVYSEGGGLIVAHQDCESNHNRLTLPIGARGPLINNCAGHVLLAFSSYDARERMLSAYLAKDKTPPVNQKKLREDLVRVRDQGFEAMESPVLIGVYDIGYPIFDRYDSVVAVLMVSMLLYRDQKQAARFDSVLNPVLRQHIKSAAADISAQIGNYSE